MAFDQIEASFVENIINVSKHWALCLVLLGNTFWGILSMGYFGHSWGSVKIWICQMTNLRTWEIQTENFDAMKRKEIGQSVAEGNLHF